MPDEHLSAPVIDDTLVSLASVDIRALLESRPYRPPDYEAEDRALAALATALAENPRDMLQKLVETAITLCQADTAGISLLEHHAGVDVSLSLAHSRDISSK